MMIVYGVIISMSIANVLFITGALTYIYVLCMAVSNLNLQSVSDRQTNRVAGWQ